MNRRQNDTIGAIAGYVLLCVIVAVVCGGAALVEAQVEIDRAVAGQAK